MTPPVTRGELRKRIVQVYQEIPTHFLLNATMGISRRCQQCLEQHGDNFEQLEYILYFLQIWLLDFGFFN
jgi:hypothetical protein